jgi:hypothetical protein
MQDEIKCPKCADVGKLKHSMCGHMLCQKCFDATYHKSSEEKCYSCPVILSTKDFYPKNYEEVQVENDNKNREVVLKVFTRRRHDFKSQAAYDDYLELIEDCLHILNNKESTQEQKQQVRVKLEQEKRENQEIRN